MAVEVAVVSRPYELRAHDAAGILRRRHPHADKQCLASICADIAPTVARDHAVLASELLIFWLDFGLGLGFSCGFRS
jgi:hypothetical protein